MADFKSRKADDLSNVIAVPGHGWEYIPIHPMADEAEWLAAHRLGPSDCTKVDCYWRLGEDVVFLQVYSTAHGWDRPPGLYARWDNNTIPMLYLSAVVESPRVSRSVVEGVIKELHELHSRRDLFLREDIGGQLVKVGGSRPETSNKSFEMTPR